VNVTVKVVVPEASPACLVGYHDEHRRVVPLMATRGVPVKLRFVIPRLSTVKVIAVLELPTRRLPERIAQCVGEISGSLPHVDLGCNRSLSGRRCRILVCVVAGDCNRGGLHPQASRCERDWKVLVPQVPPA